MYSFSISFSFSSAWNPVKELKAYQVSARPNERSRLWNPVKELKVDAHSCSSFSASFMWNPVKELKALRQQHSHHVDEHVTWNPVKELKVLHPAPVGQDKPPVESGEGIERRR